MTQEESLQKKVLSAIESTQLKPRPKWYFYSQSALLAFSLILVGLLLVFFSSLIVFNLRQNGAWFAPGFGFSGLRVFFVSVPWLLIIAVLMLLVVVEILLKHYQFAYRRPLLYTFVGAGLVFSLGTIFVLQLHIHEELLDRAREHRLIFGEPFYRRYGMPDRGSITRGQITEKTDVGCTVRTLADEILNVLIGPQTRLPMNYEVGDTVVVIGPRDDNTINALGIIKINGSPAPQFLPHPQYRSQ